jgi:hypothetical protein
MAAYLSRLWDEYSKIVLTNTRDFDARDADYETKVSDKVWLTVERLRSRRVDFRKMIQAELRITERLDTKKKRTKRKS